MQEMPEAARESAVEEGGVEHASFDDVFFLVKNSGWSSRRKGIWPLFIYVCTLHRQFRSILFLFSVWSTCMAGCGFLFSS